MYGCYISTVRWHLATWQSKHGTYPLGRNPFLLCHVHKDWRRCLERKRVSGMQICWHTLVCIYLSAHYCIASCANNVIRVRIPRRSANPCLSVTNKPLLVLIQLLPSMWFHRLLEYQQSHVRTRMIAKEKSMQCILHLSSKKSTMLTHGLGCHEIRGVVFVLVGILFGGLTILKDQSLDIEGP